MKPLSDRQCLPSVAGQCWPSVEKVPGAGVRAIVEPGGSVRDGDVIAAAQSAGVTLYFTGARHFFH